MKSRWLLLLLALVLGTNLIWCSCDNDDSGDDDSAVEVAYGACCANSQCAVTTYEDCRNAWQGPETMCSPNPCQGDQDDDDDDDDAAGDFSCNSEVCIDTDADLMWQNGSDCCYDWEEAKSYCQNLDWGDYQDWHLPSIDELRSLIRDCGGTATGGSCGVDGSCLTINCWNDPCDGCSANGGPAEGCYWPSPLNGDCFWYWSSSAVADIEFHAWHVYFNYGHLGYGNVDGRSSVRCVR